jgi:hypothetical protein
MSAVNRETISNNFKTLKVISIMIIFLGHFFQDTFLWVPATFGLLIFAHSSAYFTTLKYNGSFNIQKYWFQKIYRLGINLLVINLFLGWLFIIQEKKGLWTWQTIVNIFGMSGFLNWFKISNPSPFGAGVWFLTLLLMFYFIYPFLNKFLEKKELIILFFLTGVFILEWLNKKVVIGHALWYTIFAFMYGFVAAKIDFRLSKKVAVLTVLMLLSLLIFLNYFLQIKKFNFLLFISIFCFFVLYVEHLPLPKSVNLVGNFLSKYIFEIYLIHAYLILKLTQIQSIDFLLSLLLVIFTSIFLARISRSIKHHLFDQKIQAA